MVRKIRWTVSTFFFTVSLYLFSYGCAGSLLLHGLFSSWGEQGLFSGCSERGLLSSSGHKLLTEVASLVAEDALQGTWVSVAVAPGLLSTGFR